MKLLKTIANHPGVADYSSEYHVEFGTAHDVILKEGWHFAALDGNAKRDDWAHRMTGIFYSAKEFTEALPTPHHITN